MFTTGGRGSHYEALLSDGPLSADELERTLRQARIDLASSSGDLSAMLSKVPVSQVTTSSAREALGEALSSIESDGDKAKTVAEVILHADADELLLVAARAGRTIESDGDKARLLMATAARYLGARSEVLRSAYFDVAESVQSDGDKRRVLTTAAPYGHADQGVTLAVIRATTGMESSGEQAAVLTTLASQRLIVTPALKDAYLRAADRIESEGDRSRVLRAAREP